MEQRSIASIEDRPSVVGLTLPSRGRGAHHLLRASADWHFDLLPRPSGFKVVVVPVRDGYERWAGAYDTLDNPLVKAEQPVARSLLGSLRGKRVLDLACGTGRHLPWLAREAGSVVGVDLTRAMLSHAVARALPVRLIEGDIGAVPLRGGSFDAVLCALAMEHVEDLRGALREAKRLLAGGGRLVVTSFHPALIAMGLPVFFDDASSRIRYELHPSVAHFGAAYFKVAREVGLAVQDIREEVVSRAMARRYVQLHGREGWPLLLAVALRKPRS